MEEPSERVIRRQTRGQERQGELTYISIQEGIDKINGTDGRATKMRAYNPISERTCTSSSNQGPGMARGRDVPFIPRGY